MRLPLHVFWLAAAFLIVGCDFARGQWGELKDSYRETTTKPREITRGAKPEVVIKGNDITFDGQQLKLGVPVEEWIQILGPNFRKFPEPAYAALIWDDHGLQAFVAPSNKGIDVVDGLGVELNFKQTYSESEAGFESSKPGSGSSPAKFFRGYLEINGLAIDANSTIRETNRRASGELSISCSRGINICVDDITPGTGKLVPYFDVDRRKEDSVIYGVSVSIPLKG